MEAWTLLAQQLVLILVVLFASLFFSSVISCFLFHKIRSACIIFYNHHLFSPFLSRFHQERYVHKNISVFVQQKNTLTATNSYTQANELKEKL
jgi:hypothetical protein